VNRILTLTKREFAETPVFHISPIAGSGYKEGIHTLVSCGAVTVLDSKRYIFTPEVIADRVKNKLLRLYAVTAKRRSLA